MKELLDLVNDHPLQHPGNYFMGSRLVRPFLPENILILPRGRRTAPSIRPGVHHRYLLAVNLAGKGEIIVDSIRFSFLPGTCYLVFPHQYHYFSYMPDHVWLFITFELPGETQPDMLRGRVFSPPESFYGYLKEILRNGSTRNGQTPAPEKLTLLSGLLLTELVMLAERDDYLSAETIKLKDDFADKVNRYIQRFLDRSLQPEELAEHFGYSTSHFRALYRKSMGVGIMTYIRRTRLNYALGLLRNSSMRLEDVALRCGYDSVYAFSHAFKKHFGRPPGSFRNQG